MADLVPLNLGTWVQIQALRELIVNQKADKDVENSCWNLMLKITKPFIIQKSQSSSFRCKALLNLSFFLRLLKRSIKFRLFCRNPKWNVSTIKTSSFDRFRQITRWDRRRSFRGKCRKIKFWALTITRVLENSLERWLLLICKKMSPPSCFVKIFATLGDKSEEFLRPGVDCDEHAINYFRYHYFSVSWLADSGKMHRPSPAPAPRHRQP